MPISLSAHRLENKETNWMPKAGITLDWCGLVFCLRVQSKNLFIGIDGSAKSKLQRVKSLPRSSFTFEMANFTLAGRSASIIETVLNLKKGKYDLQSAATQQLKEIKSPEEVWKKLNKPVMKAPRKPALMS